MSADEFDRWLDALAGREVDGGGEEGRALRAQTQAQPPEPASVAEIDPMREAQLIARARAAGLLPTEKSRRAAAAAPLRSSVARWALAAAAVAGIAIGVNTLRYMRVPPETFRGATNGVVELGAVSGTIAITTPGGKGISTTRFTVTGR
jgi:hypothetical protein